jgi:hypothetical protein
MRLLMAAIFAIAALATLMDFSSKVLSIASDGLLMILLSFGVVLMYRLHKAEVAKLKAKQSAS